MSTNLYCQISLLKPSNALVKHAILLMPKYKGGWFVINPLKGVVSTESHLYIIGSSGNWSDSKSVGKLLIGAIRYECEVHEENSSHLHIYADRYTQELHAPCSVL